MSSHWTSMWKPFAKNLGQLHSNLLVLTVHDATSCIARTNAVKEQRASWEVWSCNIRGQTVERKAGFGKWWKLVRSAVSIVCRNRSSIQIMLSCENRAKKKWTVSLEKQMWVKVWVRSNLSAVWSILPHLGEARLKSGVLNRLKS